MFLSSIKEINRLLKEINKLLKEINNLLSKGMSHINLKVTTEKKWPTQNFGFLSLKNLSPGQFLASSDSRRYHCVFKIRGLGAKRCVVFLSFLFWKK